jgi:hypothetical protein
MSYYNVLILTRKDKSVMTTSPSRYTLEKMSV